MCLLLRLNVRKWLRFPDESGTEYFVGVVALIYSRDTELLGKFLSELSGLWSLTHEFAKAVVPVQYLVIENLILDLFISLSVPLFERLACFVLV